MTLISNRNGSIPLIGWRPARKPQCVALIIHSFCFSAEPHTAQAPLLPSPSISHSCKPRRSLAFQVGCSPSWRLIGRARRKWNPATTFLKQWPFVPPPLPVLLPLAVWSPLHFQSRPAGRPMPRGTTAQSPCHEPWALTPSLLVFYVGSILIQLCWALSPPSPLTNGLEGYHSRAYLSPFFIREQPSLVW